MAKLVIEVPEELRGLVEAFATRGSVPRRWWRRLGPRGEVGSRS